MEERISGKSCSVFFEGCGIGREYIPPANISHRKYLSGFRAGGVEAFLLELRLRFLLSRRPAHPAARPAARRTFPLPPIPPGGAARGPACDNNKVHPYNSVQQYNSQDPKITYLQTQNSQTRIGNAGM